ncbi:MAG: glutamate--tRNA ligase [Candidatus Pacearchaeota archaeon]
MAEITKEVIRAYALENALKHEGKSNERAVLSGLFAEGLEKTQIKDYVDKVREVVEEVNSLSLERQKEEILRGGHKISKRKVREGLPELEGAVEGKVVMRMPPFPSGPLHIGNARTLILNDEYVKMYKGKLFLVMDDTIGSAEKQIEPEAYKLIEDGVKWLGVKYEKKIIYKSDRLKIFYDYAEELLRKGYMYVCECSPDKMRELRAKGVECSCRRFSPEQQVERWKKMFNAPMGSMCVRLKTSMQDPDPAFRDRVMFKISDNPHPRTKKKYRVYPSMDFSWAIDDHLLGVTHILRGTDLVIETRVEKHIWNIFGWEHPKVVYNGHFAIEGVKISKSKGSKEVRSGVYIGWNDPRTWSLQSLKDRGIHPEAIRQFILSIGLNKTNIKVPVEVLYALNRKFLESVPRYFFVEEPEKIRIKGCPELVAKIPLHPDGKKGYKVYNTKQEFFISKPDYEVMQNRNYRLMHLLNFKSEQVLAIKPREFSFISEEPTNDLETKFIHWLPANADNVKTEIRMSDGSVVNGLSEPEVRKLKVGDIIQFERFGFVRLYKKKKDRLELWFAHF